MIDFNDGEEMPNKFGGSEAKTTVLYKNTVYIIKYPDPVRQKKNILSYMNNQFSEHIGCRIFAACGINAQETVLGYLKDINGKNKIVVGCKDFTQDGSKLHEFSKFVNQVQVEGKEGLTIESVVEVINRSRFVDNKEITEKFWDMFVVDALIGNSDRHFDNWGIIEKGNYRQFAPIYDCGSALASLLHDDKMKELLDNHIEFKNQEYNRTSCYNMGGKKIYYHEIFKNPPEDLTQAIKRVIPKINMAYVYEIIDSVCLMSDVRKEYLKNAVKIRYEQILKPALNKLLVARK